MHDVILCVCARPENHLGHFLNTVACNPWSRLGWQRACLYVWAPLGTHTWKPKVVFLDHCYWSSILLSPEGVIPAGLVARLPKGVSAASAVYRHSAWPRACAVNTSSTEPSPQPSSYSTHFYFRWTHVLSLGVECFIYSITSSVPSDF